MLWAIKACSWISQLEGPVAKHGAFWGNVESNTAEVDTTGVVFTVVDTTGITTGFRFAIGVETASGTRVALTWTGVCASTGTTTGATHSSTLGPVPVYSNLY